MDLIRVSATDIDALRYFRADDEADKLAFFQRAAADDAGALGFGFGHVVCPIHTMQPLASPLGRGNEA